MTEFGADGADGEEVMGLVDSIGFNRRDLETWRALNMDAATCRVDDELIGAIPYERRRLQLAPGRTINVAHESIVGVKPSARGGGIGSKMQDALAAERPGGLDALTVFREKPESGAHRWYRANGFEPIVGIGSFLLDEPDAPAGPEAVIVPASADDGTIPWARLDGFRASVFSQSSGGHLERPTRSLEPWLRVHPYRASYRYAVAALGSLEQPAALAVLGIGRLHSEGDRMEILELSVPGWDPGPAEELVAALRRHAVIEGLAPLRWALAETDPFVAVAESAGLTKRWSFDFLVRPLVPAVDVGELRAVAKSTPWRHQAIDYI